MMQANMFRFDKLSTHTMSAFVIGGRTFYIIERPWLNNERNRSCIPTGDYICYFLKRSASGKYRNVYHIRPVNGRSGILIHSGNLVTHSLGCPIMGTRMGFLGGKPAVLSSRKAIRELNKITGKKDFRLKIL